MTTIPHGAYLPLSLRSLRNWSRRSFFQAICGRTEKTAGSRGKAASDFVHPFAARVRAAEIARQMRSLVAGISMWVMPNSASASTMALITAPSAGVTPPSPPERTPSGFVVDGISLISVANDGTVSARGIA